jgi:hypothetical protein
LPTADPGMRHPAGDVLAGYGWRSSRSVAHYSHAVKPEPAARCPGGLAGRGSVADQGASILWPRQATKPGVQRKEQHQE